MDDFNKGLNALFYDMELIVVAVVVLAALTGIALFFTIAFVLKRRLERSRVTAGAPERADVQSQS